MNDLISRKAVIEGIDYFISHTRVDSDENYAYVQCKKFIEKLLSAQQWIPVEERLPESRKSVLIYTSRNLMAVGFIDKRKNWYVEDGDWYCTDLTVEPIAWMPLPEPYKGE